MTDQNCWNIYTYESRKILVSGADKNCIITFWCISRKRLARSYTRFWIRKLYPKPYPHRSIVHTRRFKRNSTAIWERFMIVMSLFAVRLQFGIWNHIWNLSELHPLRASSSIFSCAPRMFLFFVNVEPPCHLVTCERTTDFGHKFVTVTTTSTAFESPVWTTLNKSNAQVSI